MALFIFGTGLCTEAQIGVVKDSVSIDGQHIDEEASPPANVNFIKVCSRKMRYPADARRFGIEGTALVECIVDRDVTLINMRSVGNVGGGCDEEALRVMGVYAEKYRWLPAKAKGQPVQQNITVPLKFKLA